MDKWLIAMWMLSNCKNGISSYEIARAIGVTQKTVVHCSNAFAMRCNHGTFDKMSGTVEADETFIGGKQKNRHMKKRQKLSGPMGKTPVIGAIARKVRFRPGDPVDAPGRLAAAHDGRGWR